MTSLAASAGATSAPPAGRGQLGPLARHEHRQSQAGYRFTNHLRLAVDVFNLLDSNDSDIEYFYRSRLPGEPPAGVDDIHFHPTLKRTVRVSLTVRMATSVTCLPPKGGSYRWDLRSYRDLISLSRKL